jgi:hypothetical protein
VIRQLAKQESLFFAGQRVGRACVFDRKRLESSGGGSDALKSRRTSRHVGTQREYHGLMWDTIKANAGNGRKEPHHPHFNFEWFFIRFPCE